MRTIPVVTLSIALAALTRPALAGPEEEAAAEALFQEGLRLMQEERFPEACPKLAESQRLDPAVGTLLYLGECYEKNGQVASAWATFQSAAAAARKEGQDDRRQIALERASRLEHQMPKLVVDVDPAARVAGLVVTRDASDLAEAAWRVPIPVDPGSHVVSASAPGKRSWTRTVTLEAGQGVVTVQVPTLADEVAAPPAPARGATPAPAGTEAGAGAPPAPAEGGRSRLAPAYVTGAVGLVVLGGGVGAGIASNAKERESVEFCNPSDPSECNRTGMSLLDDARTYATAANVAYAVGGAALVTSVVLFVTARRPSPATAGWQLVPIATPEGAGAVLRGGF
ncbi:MAG TPA: hypothetical protein PLU22_22930 [Polyangiaceae bacterium]|nr:hypothetical protein [Polyangiaceae bacterium]